MRRLVSLFYRPCLNIVTLWPLHVGATRSSSSKRGSSLIVCGALCARVCCLREGLKVTNPSTMPLEIGVTMPCHVCTLHSAHLLASLLSSSTSHHPKGSKGGYLDQSRRPTTCSLAQCTTTTAHACGCLNGYRFVAYITAWSWLGRYVT